MRHTVGNEAVKPIARAIAQTLDDHGAGYRPAEVYEDILGFMRLYLDAKCTPSDADEAYTTVYVNGVLIAANAFSEAYFG